MKHSAAQIRRSIAAFPARDLPDSSTLSHAAVAIVVRENAEIGDVELLMIRRAEHPRDPWSGQMGFPGGRVDPGDATPFAAACRETSEELGVDLARSARFLGRLSELRARSRRKILAMGIFPYVFEATENLDFQLNYEVAEAVWIPLGFFLERENRTEMTVLLEKGDAPFPCYRYQDRPVWGLSLLMLDEFLFEALPAWELPR